MDLSIANKFEDYRREQLRELCFWIAGPFAIIVVLQSIFTDLKLYPQFWTKTWLWLRLGIIPVSIASILFLRTKLAVKWAEISIVTVALYIAFFHTYLIAKTGYANSKYFHSYVQILLGLSIIPFRPWVFFLTALTILGTYVGTIILGSNVGVSFLFSGDPLFLKTYVLMIFLLFFAISRTRKTGYVARHRLEVELGSRQAEINRLVEIESTVREQNAVVNLATQVAHDIRSPLTALNVAAESLAEIPESTRSLIRNAIIRIKDITNNLLQSNRDQKDQIENDEIRPFVIISLLDNVITEKKIQFTNRRDILFNCQWNVESVSVLSNVHSGQFKRLVSNLINNSIEAKVQNRDLIVSILLKKEDSKITLTISDNGCGMGVESLARAVERGYSEKVNGLGLGLFHAREQIEKWNGKLNVDSKSSEGTTVTIELPEAEEPNWLTSEITINEDAHLFILDDDSTIHQIWDQRFKPVTRAENIHHFKNSKEMSVYFNSNQDKTRNGVFLIDYELHGEEVNGLEIIQDLGINDRSFLVTSHAEERKLTNTCEENNIKLLSKNIAHLIPIRSL